MFCSFVQLQLLVLALCSLVVARRLSQGDGLTVPAQRPMLHSRPATVISNEVKSDSPKDVSTSGRDATIKLFPPSPLAMRYSFSFGCKESEFNTITLETDVCLSGDYYLNHNMLISEAPLCKDGSTPTMSYYRARGCVGSPQFESTTKPIPDYCLWGGIAPKYWSLIFRCGSETSTVQGADKHEVAVPPASRQPTQVYEGILSLCAFERTHRRIRPSRSMVNVDSCIPMNGHNITIKREAVCPNGKRAQWARFETANCNGGHLSQKYGLIDIHDADIGVDKCLSSSASADKDKIRSVAFWCEGIKLVPPKKSALKWGTFGEQACSAGGSTPKFLSHGYKPLQPDTCAPKDRGVALRTFTISQPAVCENGTRAALALYKDDFCSGEPDRFLNVQFNTMNKCLSFEGVQSWAFYCEGVKIQRSLRVMSPPRPPSLGAQRISTGEQLEAKLKAQATQTGFLVGRPSSAPARPAPVIASDFGKAKPLPDFQINAHAPECVSGCANRVQTIGLNTRYRYSAFSCNKNMETTVKYYVPGICTALNSPFGIQSPGICPNGKPALVALYQDRSCQGKPDKFGSVDTNSTNQCFAFDEMKGWTFWCEDVEPGDVSSLKDIGTKVEEVNNGVEGWAKVIIYLVCAVVLALGVWFWLGAVILHVARELFPWPFEAVENGRIVLGEEKP
ncbi:uncharacterized protein LY89DRAFT_713431 [Mollisia scopiformis]|uniref:Uncharacterized protein n=1 Tax=Mollisia scopiformis TaxID=149040 RepID=A0A194XXR5_MOLSC|nr:uncharacterized protein LY89DRAFT_713431 [Mollisia scopiformis]KUJ24622.1 hypothetical protein LY89DRAFT_713431 [Mollisia scopiformis]